MVLGARIWTPYNTPTSIGVRTTVPFPSYQYDRTVQVYASRTYGIPLCTGATIVLGDTGERVVPSGLYIHRGNHTRDGPPPALPAINNIL